MMGPLGGSPNPPATGSGRAKPARSPTRSSGHFPSLGLGRGQGSRASSRPSTTTKSRSPTKNDMAAPEGMIRLAAVPVERDTSAVIRKLGARGRVRSHVRHTRVKIVRASKFDLFCTLTLRGAIEIEYAPGLSEAWTEDG